LISRALSTVARKINSHGDVVGDYRDASGTTYGYLLSRDRFTPKYNGVLPGGVSRTDA